MTARLTGYAAMLAFALSYLPGCTLMKTKEELRHAEVRQENISLKGNYQSLLKCWDDKAEKLSIDFVNQTASHIYQDLGLAEITVGGAGGKYALYVELKRAAPDQTIVNAYGTGSIGAQKIPEWLALLRLCQSERP